MFLISNSWANDWISIDSVEFNMGCDSSKKANCSQDELPAHKTVLRSYDIQRTEVTQTEWAACVDAGVCAPTPYHWNPKEQADWPVTGMNRLEAEAYCTWIGGRLPTEAEWELAARGTDGRMNPWGDADASCEVARLRGCGDLLGPVTAFPKGASPYGVMDMVGNAWEFVSDFYRSDYYGQSPVDAPQGPTNSNLISIRSPNSFDLQLPTATARIAAPQMVRASVLGLRCARDGAR
jgi:formylglycine-generating enzyme required for sulfatase activity